MNSMARIDLTIKNYRCFDDANPLRISLSNGFVAFVGPNNSGKSSALKFFYEVRQLWQRLQVVDVFRGSYENAYAAHIQYQGVHDPEEIFSNRNDRPITIELMLSGGARDAEAPPTVDFFRGSCSRLQMNLWKCEFRAGQIAVPHIPHTSQLSPAQVFGRQVEHLQIGGQSFDYSVMLSALRILDRMLYIGPYRNAITEGAAQYFDLVIGSQFIETWSQWKTGGVKAHGRAIESITSNIRQIFEYDAFEINASLTLKTLTISINGGQYRLSELGAGLAQFIITFGNAAIRSPSYILIDEPELHLHPSLQIDFLTSLASYATQGVVFATHSIGLARTTGDDIYSFQKVGGASVVKPFAQTPNYAEFAGELSFSSFKEMGYERILLVEGVNDVKAVQQLLRLLKKDHKIVILPLGGDQLAKGGVEQELGEFNRLGAKVSAIVDSERAEKGAPPKKERKDFQSICHALGIDVLITERRAIENYFSDRAVKATFSEKYSGLAHYEPLENCALPWSKNDNWKIARNMAWDEISDSDVGTFLSSL